MIPAFDPVTLSLVLPAGSVITAGSGGITVTLPPYLKEKAVSEADPTRRDDPPVGDPDAPFPPGTPQFIIDFAAAVDAFLGENPDSSAREALAAILGRFIHKLAPKA